MAPSMSPSVIRTIQCVRISAGEDSSKGKRLNGFKGSSDKLCTNTMDGTGVFVSPQGDVGPKLVLS